jgi:uncharacterized protein YjbI with pentapeptide repeats
VGAIHPAGVELIGGVHDRCGLQIGQCVYYFGLAERFAVDQRSAIGAHAVEHVGRAEGLHGHPWPDSCPDLMACSYYSARPSALFGRMWKGRIVIEALTGQDYSDIAAGGERWHRREYTDCSFVDADLRGLCTAGCVFTRCDLSGADLGDSTHQATAFRSCMFRSTMLAGVRMDGCTLLGSTFVECRMRPVVLAGTDLRLVSLVSADLREQSLAGLRLTEANLEEADLRGADLCGADLRGARLLGTRLEGADLRGARLDANGLVQARLAGAVVDAGTAIAFAAAHGLRVEPGSGDEPVSRRGGGR